MIGGLGRYIGITHVKMAKRFGIIFFEHWCQCLVMKPIILVVFVHIACIVQGCKRTHVPVETPVHVEHNFLRQFKVIVLHTFFQSNISLHDHSSDSVFLHINRYIVIVEVNSTLML